MAFDDGLGIDSSQPVPENYMLSATGVASKTFGLWFSKIGQYILILGVVSVAFNLVSLFLLFTFFSTIGVLGIDPVSYLFSFFGPDFNPDIYLIAMTLTFAVIAYVINAFLSGAAIKYALDDYGGQSPSIGKSFSHATGKTVRLVSVQLVFSIIVTIVLSPALILLETAMSGIDFDISDPMNFVIDPGVIQLILLAMFFLLVGGIFMIYISVRLVAALPIVVDTDLSAIDSLKKSWELTSGNFFHVFGAQILVGIVVGLISGVISLGVTAALYPSPYFSVVDTVIISLFFGAINLVFGAVLYRDLMSRTRGSDLPEYVL